MCYLVGNRDHCQGTHASLEGSQAQLTGVCQEPGTAPPYVLSLPQFALIRRVCVKGAEVKVSVSLFVYSSSTVCLGIRFIVWLLRGSLNQGLEYWFLCKMTSLLTLVSQPGTQHFVHGRHLKSFCWVCQLRVSPEIRLNFFTARRYPRKGLLFKSN